MRDARGGGGGGWGQSLPQGDIEDGAEVWEGWGMRKRQKEENVNRIFLGVSHLINSLDLRGKMRWGLGGGGT